MIYTKEGNHPIPKTMVASLLPEMQGEAYIGTRLIGGISYAKDARLSRFNRLNSGRKEPHELGIKYDGVNS